MLFLHFLEQVRWNTFCIIPKGLFPRYHQMNTSNLTERILPHQRNHSHVKELNKCAHWLRFPLLFTVSSLIYLGEFDPSTAFSLTTARPDDVRRELAGDVNHRLCECSGKWLNESRWGAARSQLPVFLAEFSTFVIASSLCRTTGWGRLMIRC
jgi:hypothetical protein